MHSALSFCCYEHEPSVETIFLRPSHSLLSAAQILGSIISSSSQCQTAGRKPKEKYAARIKSLMFLCEPSIYFVYQVFRNLKSAALLPHVFRDSQVGRLTTSSAVSMLTFLRREVLAFVVPPSLCPGTNSTPDTLRSTIRGLESGGQLTILAQCLCYLY